MQGTTKKGFSRGIFCLCVENVMHVLDPFFFISSHRVGRLHGGHIWPNRFCTYSKITL